MWYVGDDSLRFSKLLSTLILDTSKIHKIACRPTACKSGKCLIFNHDFIKEFRD